MVEGLTKSGLLQLSQGYSHCAIVADFWSAPSFVFLKKYQGSNREYPFEFLSSCEGNCESLLDLLSPCEHNRPPLGYLDYHSGEKRSSLRDRDRLKTIPSGFPVVWVAVPGCSRNSYGTNPNLRVQKILVMFWQCTQDTGLFPTEFFRKFFSCSPLDLFANLWDVLLSHFCIKRVLWPIFPGNLRCFSGNCC